MPRISAHPGGGLGGDRFGDGFGDFGEERFTGLSEEGFMRALRKMRTFGLLAFKTDAFVFAPPRSLLYAKAFDFPKTLAYAWRAICDKVLYLRARGTVVVLQRGVDAIRVVNYVANRPEAIANLCRYKCLIQVALRCQIALHTCNCYCD